MSPTRTLPIAFLLAATAPAQLLVIDDVPSSSALGNSAVILDDLDGDGVRELGLGLPHDFEVACNTTSQFSAFEIRSGADGALLRRETFPLDEHVGHSLLALGDVDGDGVGDYAVGSAPDICCWFNTIRLRAYSGASGAPLWSVFPLWFDIYGQSMVALGDLDGDGLADLATGETDTNNGPGLFDNGRVDARRGLTGGVLWTSAGTATDDEFGNHLARLGDVTGDGLDELVASSTAGYSRLLDGANGATLAVFAFDGPLFEIGDHDGDGQPDFAVARPGQVELRAASGALLTTLPGDWSNLAAAGDVDLDGTPDYVLAQRSWNQLRGRAVLVSGASGAELVELFTGEDVFDRVGESLSPVVDLGGGPPEVLVGAPGAQAGGQVRVYTLPVAAPPTVVCQGQPNSAGSGATLASRGTWSLGNNDFQLTSAQLPPDHFGFYFYGDSQVALPFGDGLRCAGGSLTRLYPPQDSGPRGVIERALDWTAAPSSSGPGQVLPGSSWTFQLWYRDVPAMQSGFNASAALHVTFSE